VSESASIMQQGVRQVGPFSEEVEESVVVVGTPRAGTVMNYSGAQAISNKFRVASP